MGTQDGNNDEQAGDGLEEHLDTALEEIRGDRSFDDTDSEDLDGQLPADTQGAEGDQAGAATGDQEDPPAEKAADLPGGDGQTGGEAEGPGAEGTEDTKGPDKDTVDGDAEPDKDVDAKASDDPLDGVTNERTRERMTKFIDENKSLKETLTAAQEGTAYLNQEFTASGMTAEQLTAVIELVKFSNTGQSSMLKEIYPRIQAMMQQAGVAIADPNVPLTHLPQELQQSVDNLDITPELARQQAALQANQLAQQQQQHQQQQEANNRQAYNDGASKGATDIAAWEKQMALTDPDFTAKQAQLLTNAQEVMGSLPPNQWLRAMQTQYNTITATMNTMSQQQKLAQAKLQPMRPGKSVTTAAPGEADSFESNFQDTLNRLRA